MKRIIYPLITVLLVMCVPADTDVLRTEDAYHEHEVHFANTDHELHVYYINGREPGNTILLIGGMHGDEPGGYLAADKYVDISLKRGNLIIVPRTNLDAILSNDRSGGGDFNRKFAGELHADRYDDRIIMVLKELMEKSDLVLNLHDGSGFYRDTWVDKWHNPFRFGQSIISDCELYDSGRDGKPIMMGQLGRKVVGMVNAQLDNPNYVFTYANHDSISPDTKYPDMRKTATYYALTQHKIPAFGIETSKSLPSTDLKVAHQVLVINAFLEEFDVVMDVPPMRILEPRMDYVIIDVNKTSQYVLRNNGTIYVDRGDTIRVDHIVGNYDRLLFADFVGIGGRNDNQLEVKVNRTMKLVVRKDSTICGEATIIPRDQKAVVDDIESADTAPAFIVEVNGESKTIPAGSSVKVIEGDNLVIREYVAKDTRNVNVNLMGFVGDPSDNRGEDRGFTCNTAKDLLKNWSVNGQGKKYTIAAKRNARILNQIIVEVLKPEVRYLAYKIDGKRPVIVESGDSIELNGGNRLSVFDIASNLASDQTFNIFSVRRNGRSRKVEQDLAIRSDTEGPLVALRIDYQGREIARFPVVILEKPTQTAY